MATRNLQKGAYLAVDRLPANPALARRLPAEMAWRFHALPLAEDRGSVTVAVANPDDAAAREAVAAALGPAVCLVQGDPQVIDTLLAQVWQTGDDHLLNIWACGDRNPVSPEVWDYAQALASLLGARVTRHDRVEGLVPGQAPPDLVVVACSEGQFRGSRIDSARLHSLLSEPRRPTSTARRASTGAERLASAPQAVVAVARSRWPLNRLLLVICGQEEDRAALDWVARLAQKSNGTVTVLAVVPPAPAMYGCGGRMGQDLPGLLNSNTSLGRGMRAAARYLVDSGIQSTLRLRQGPPDWQIGREVAEGDYDLIGIGADPCSRLRRWLAGDLIDHLLSQADRPLLVAKTSAREG